MKRTLSILSLASILSTCHAEIGGAEAVRAIIGEAGNQSDRAMLAVACALRNRGSLAGVYGVDNPVVNRAGEKLRARAAQAWRASALRDIVRGCRYFGCPHDAPYFLHRLHFHPVLTIGAITFYQP